MEKFDVVLVGGGIIGCSLARALAAEKLRVAVVERGRPGEEASWAAAGMLAPSAEAHESGALFGLSRSSARLYPAFAAELQAETGIDVQYRTEGALFVVESEQERIAMLPGISWQREQGIAVEEIAAAALSGMEPSLANCTGAFFLPEDCQIDNRLLMQALVASCRRRGVEFILGRSVVEIEGNGDGATGVRLENESIAAGRVVNTAGAWAGAITAGKMPAAPIRPVKGHMIALQSVSPPLRAPLRHVVRSHRVYLVPRNDGRVLVGSTMEESGFDKTARSGPIARLLAAAHHFCPTLEQCPIQDVWAGLRPSSPDALPILGPSLLPNYWLALGHFRNGILLAPITAQIMSLWMLTGDPMFDVESFSPRRFGQ